MGVVVKATRRIGRLAIVEVLCVAFLVSSLLVKAVECSVGKSAHGAVDVEDNEFAEFEEFDEPHDEDFGGKNGDKVGEMPPPGGGRDEGGRHEDPIESMEDDLDESIVEDEVDDDEFAHLHDSEEFENFEESRLAGGEKRTDGGKAGAPQSLKFADVPSHLRNNWSNYQVELLMIFALAIYFLNYVYGRSKNQSMAQSWFDAHRDILQQQFSLVGDDGSSADACEGAMVRETDSSFSIWCSGRSGCQGMLIQLKLLKRQDLVSVISQLMRPKYDRVVVRVDLDSTEMDSFVFAVGQKKSLAKIGKEMSDLSQFCAEKRNTGNYGLPSSFTVLGEIAEATAAMLDPKTTAMLSKYEDCVDYLHFSDQYTGPKPQEGETQARLPETCKVLFFSFNIPGKLAASERQVEYTKPILNLVFYSLEKIRRYRLSREGKMKADKNRQAAQQSFLKTTHTQRQEAAQQRREDKIRERKEKLMAEEDPDKQRRLEKAEQKREAKKKQPKMKQLKIKAM